jgi:seryl-tRNA synthetase
MPNHQVEYFKYQLELKKNQVETLKSEQNEISESIRRLGDQLNAKQKELDEKSVLLARTTAERDEYRDQNKNAQRYSQSQVQKLQDRSKELENELQAAQDELAQVKTQGVQGSSQSSKIRLVQLVNGFNTNSFLVSPDRVYFSLTKSSFENYNRHDVAVDFIDLEDKKVLQSTRVEGIATPEGDYNYEVSLKDFNPTKPAVISVRKVK